jgi:molybdopterin converting factor small subunit
MAVAPVTVALGTVLRDYTRGAATVTVTPARPDPTLADVLAALDADYPGIRFRMMDEAGRVRPHVQVFVGGRIQRDPAAPVRPGEEVFIVGALSGG